MDINLRLRILVSTGMLLVNCGGGGGSSSNDTAVSPPPPVTTTVSYSAEVAFPGLVFTDPLYLTALPTQPDQLLVVEQSGRIQRFTNDPATSTATTFLDIRSRVNSGSEQGLLGLAFDPDFASNGSFYVHYSAIPPRRSVIARYQMDGALEADPDSEEILLEVAQPFSNHNGGMIEFGPDGMLYIGLGDGGGSGDPDNNAQDPTTLLGALLRIDPDGGSPYGIPADNPFVGEGGGVREEIWAFGLRNPYRFSFDRQSGQLWLGDVGEASLEEINIITKGGNYGWRVFEGTMPFNDSGNSLPPSAFTPPVYEYSHSLGCSITGGYVYRGSLLPSLQGQYIYGDYCSGRIWALEYSGGSVQSNTEIAMVPSVSSFGEDGDGELYIVSLSGDIYRLVETESANGQ